MSVDVTPHGRVAAEMENLAEAVLSPERKRSRSSLHSHSRSSLHSSPDRFAYDEPSLAASEAPYPPNLGPTIEAPQEESAGAPYFFCSRNRTLCRCLDRSRCFFFSEQHILSVYSTSVIGNRRFAIFRGPKNVLLARR